jgi:hypothetical protein
MLCFRAYVIGHHNQKKGRIRLAMASGWRWAELLQLPTGVMASRFVNVILDLLDGILDRPDDSRSDERHDQESVK